MNVLIPKKGSKEQVKLEEGRLLYAMVYGKKINLPKLIVERLRGAMGRKSIPICYEMHLVEMMGQAGVNLTCAGDDEFNFSSTIDHHTLKRLGYRFQHGGWDFVGRGKVNTSFPVEGQEARMQEEEEEEELEPTIQAESAAPSHPIPRPRSIQTSQIPTLATKSDIAHLQQFMVEQFHLLQATLLSKLETMDSRLQVCEQHILHQTYSSPIPPSQPSTDPKGKAPMVTPIPSPITSPHTSPLPTPHIPSPPSPLFQKSPLHDPIPIPSKSSHSSSSSSSSSTSPSQQFELAARTPSAHSPTSHSSDSEASPSDPLSYLTPQPSPAPPTPTSQPIASTPSTCTKQFASKNPSFTPSPPSSPPLPPSQPTQPPPPPPQPSSSLRLVTTSYTHRKLAVTRPSTSPPPHPPPA